ncbi:hypothetical protein ABRG53_3366 [Pseudanabaena sp. ABRG5-3]|nr:hypothetical protein ABRG53_3366 [Pseudanabaena sp. ABRG5-3]
MHTESNKSVVWVGAWSEAGDGDIDYELAAELIIIIGGCLAIEDNLPTKRANYLLLFRKNQ